MTRDMLRVDKVPPLTKTQLQESARRLYGRPNASMLVRALIVMHLAKDDAKGKGEPKATKITKEPDFVRVELRLPRAAVDVVTELAEGRLSARNYYLTSIIMAHLGRPQLQGDEIEVLRRSNYELARIGGNINQVAKALNTILAMRSVEKVPEIGKKLSSLRVQINDHTKRVLDVLKTGSAVWDEAIGGRAQRKAKSRPNRVSR